MSKIIFNNDFRHSSYLSTEFHFKYDIEYWKIIFSEEDLIFLFKYGAWMHALAHEFINPKTDAQLNFVNVFVHNHKPETKSELLWNKYLNYSILIEYIEYIYIVYREDFFKKLSIYTDEFVFIDIYQSAEDFINQKYSFLISLYSEFCMPHDEFFFNFAQYVKKNFSEYIYKDLDFYFEIYKIKKTIQEHDFELAISRINELDKNFNDRKFFLECKKLRDIIFSYKRFLQNVSVNCLVDFENSFRIKSDAHFLNLSPEYVDFINKSCAISKNKNTKEPKYRPVIAKSERSIINPNKYDWSSCLNGYPDDWRDL